jgi:hypothetical protein
MQAAAAASAAPVDAATAADEELARRLQAKMDRQERGRATQWVAGLPGGSRSSGFRVLVF